MSKAIFASVSVLTRVDVSFIYPIVASKVTKESPDETLSPLVVDTRGSGDQVFLSGSVGVAQGRMPFFSRLAMTCKKLRITQIQLTGSDSAERYLARRGTRCKWFGAQFRSADWRGKIGIL